MDVPEVFEEYLAAWRSADEATIRLHVDRSLATSIVWCDPNYNIEGRDAVVEMIVEFHKLVPDARCRPVADDQGRLPSRPSPIRLARYQRRTLGDARHRCGHGERRRSHQSHRWVLRAARTAVVTQTRPRRAWALSTFNAQASTTGPL